MTDLIIAIKTYGTEKRNLHNSSKRVTTYKLGNGAEAEVLRLLYPNALDLSSSRTSYRYLHLPEEVIHREHFIVATITTEQQQAIETLLKLYPRHWVYLWQTHQWLYFPDQVHAEYNANLYGSGPRFKGDFEYKTTKAEPTKSGLTLTSSMKDDSIWWWIGGDTFPHREALNAAGCKWSKKRREWYFPGNPLPERIRNLVNPPDQTPDDAPYTDEEAEAILGVQLVPKPERPSPSAPPRLFQENEVVYARHDLETSTGLTIPTGTKGKVVKLYNHNATAGWSYDVEFENSGTGWFFERELTFIQPTPGFRITRGKVTPPGITEPIDAELKPQLAGTVTADETAPTEIAAHTRYRYLLPLPAGRELWGIEWEMPAVPQNLHKQFLAEGCKFQIGNRMWIYTGDSLPESIQRLVTIQTTPLEAVQQVFRNQQPADDDGTKLCPEWLQHILPYSDTNRPGATQENTLVYAHFFTADSDWHVFIKDQNIYHRDDEEHIEFFCYAILNGDLINAEWGWQSLRVLEAVKGPFGLHMERDTSFEPKSLKDALAEWKHHHGMDRPDPDEPEPEPEPELPVGPQPPRFEVNQLVFTNQDTQDLVGQLIITGARGVITRAYGWRAEIHDYQYAVNFRTPDEKVDRVIDCLESLLTDQPLPTGTRITKAPALTDEIKTIIQEAKASAAATPTRTSNIQSQTQQYPTDRKYIGELTGSVSGFVYCYNLAMSENQVLYLEFAGPQTAATAIRARISMRQGIKLLRDDAATLDLEFTKQDAFLTFAHYQPEAHIQHYILVQSIIQEPGLETLLIRTDDAQAKAKLLDLLKKHIDLPILESWIDYLWAAGRAVQLIRKPILYGDLDLYQVSLDKTRWGLLIYGGLRENTIEIA